MIRADRPARVPAQAALSSFPPEVDPHQSGETPKC